MRNFLRRLLAFLKQPWFLLLVAAVALCLVAWFAGPFIAAGAWRPLAGPAARLAVLLGIVTLWGVANLLVRLRQIHLNEELVEEFRRRQEEEKKSEAQAEEAAQEELTTIRRQAEQALKLLRTARFDRIFRRRYLYQLPWYLVIGPPASGKTTALMNAGLTFPLAGHLQTQAVPAIAGTRNCDWWLADQAVFIDTAGRYTTRERDVLVDGKVWTGLLDLLKSQRSRQPLNGAVIVVSLVELIEATEQQRLMLARSLRQRLGELYQHLRVRLPTYLLFSKLDLVLGFDEFFETIGREERGQIWGMTFPPDNGGRPGALDLFDREFTDLLAGLDRRVLRRLQEEPDIRRRARILEFPAQMSMLQPAVHSLIEAVFKPSAHEQPLLLRGVYFTSSTQEGAPIDLLEPAMAPAYGFESYAATAAPKESLGTHSYFLRRLFHDVIIAEAGLVGLDRITERWRRLGAVALASGISAAAAGLLFLWLHAYQTNRAALDQAVTAADVIARDMDALPAPSRDAAELIAVIPPLDALRALPGGSSAQSDAATALAPLGLYDANPLSAQANAAYARGLRGLLLPRLLARIETQLRQPNAEPTYLYPALKAYLTLSGHGPVDADFVLAWLKLDWRSTLAGPENAATRERLEQHAAALLTVLPGPVPIDETLVSAVRARLSVATLARRGYDILRDLAVAKELPEWRVIDHAGPAASRVLLRPSGRSLWDGIDGLYTRAGFFEVFLPASERLSENLAKEGWVLGSAASGVAQPIAAKRLRDGMLALYLDDYTRAWDKLLADIAITPFRSSEHAADVLNVLSGPNSPLKKLLQGISQETTLDPAPAAAAAAGGKLANAANAAEQAAAQAAQGANGVQQLAHLSGLGAAMPVPAPGHPVTLHFADLHDFADAHDGAPAPVDGVVKSLGDLYRVFNQLSVGASPASAGSAPGAGSDAAIAELRASASHLPAPLDQLFGAVAASGGAIVSGGARDYFTKIWRSTVLPHCEQAVDGRFPFVAAGPDETPIDDFAQLFGPEGEIARFFNTYLKPFADTEVTPWRWRKADGVDLGLGADVLAGFERAFDVSAAFFSANGKRPAASFEIAPLLVDARITTLRLDVDGQLLQYQHGPPVPATMQWLSPQGPAGAALSFAPSLDGEPGSLNDPGPWGFLRLLAAARVTKLAPDRYRLDFALSGRTATLTLKAASLHNPFDLQLVQQFRCPAW